MAFDIATPFIEDLTELAIRLVELGIVVGIGTIFFSAINWLTAKVKTLID